MLCASLLASIGCPIAGAAPGAPPDDVKQQPLPIDGTPCGEHAIAVAAIKREVDAHNRAPNTFTLPAQQAASDRYDREKAALERRQAPLIGALNSCVDFLNALRLRKEVRRPPDGFMSRATAALKALPPNYRAPAQRLRTAYGTVTVPPELHALLRVLRSAIPDGTDPVQVPTAARPAVGSIDPAFIGAEQSVPAKPDGSAAVSPMMLATPSRLLYIDGFLSLTPQYMWFILTAPANLTWATPQAFLIRASPAVAGLSAGSRSWIDSQSRDGDYFANAVQLALPELLRTINAVR